MPLLTHALLPCCVLTLWHFCEYTSFPSYPFSLAILISDWLSRVRWLPKLLLTYQLWSVTVKYIWSWAYTALSWWENCMHEFSRKCTLNSEFWTFPDQRSDALSIWAKDNELQPELSLSDEEGGVPWTVTYIGVLCAHFQLRKDLLACNLTSQVAALMENEQFRPSSKGIITVSAY